MRQFGIALHNFESSHRCLPYGTTFADFDSYGTEWISTQVQLLPHLDQMTAFQKLTSGPRVGLNGLEMTLKIPVFHCPDEPVPVGISYRTCTGSHAGYYDFPSDNYSGTLSRGYGALPGTCSLKPIRMADIRDGLSQTVAMSERTISSNSTGEFDRTTDVWFSGAFALGFKIDSNSIDDSVNVCRALTGTTTSSYSPFAGRNIIESGVVYTAYNHALPPNSSIADCAMDGLSGSPGDSWGRVGTLGVVGARSRHHDRSVCVLLMDASVRMISPEVNLETWRAMATRQDVDSVLE